MTLENHANQIMDGLWISAMPDADWDLHSWGVSVVVTLSEHLPPQAARRFEWGTHGGAAGNGTMVFAHWPFEDGDLPSRRLAELVAGFVAASVRAGLVVLVHCHEGRNRAGLIAALAVRELSGCSGTDAVAAVRAARPSVLSNRTFLEALEELPAPR